ncbi:DUF2341 domain-containing protein, partial [Candidatus Babeliales bacterium]|nr:DUF2341 domain-containing protein [Candidatus Babeliales bacterium]
MGWLNDWAFRVELVIDHDDVSAGLTDFPALIYLSSSSGITNKDLTCVFDRLGANRKKIAITKADGTTQLYVEIEKWDNSNEKAWLWVKVSNISSSEDTTLYLYYDSNQDDNTTYVGDSNSEVAENVWDTNFKLVTHMQDDPNNANVRDSTSNDNDGVKKGANEPIEADGQIGKAQDFDGANDEIDLTGLTSTSKNYTFSFWTYRSNYLFIFDSQSGRFIISAGIYVPDTTHLGFYDGTWRDLGFVIPLETLCFITITFDNNASEAKSYLNGVYQATTPYVGKNIGGAVALGSHHAFGDKYYDGIVDEFRISEVVRLPSWITASYETQRDHLITFGNEEAYLGIIINGSNYTHIIGTDFVEINTVALPEWINDATPDVDTNVWNLKPLKVIYVLRVTHAEKWVLDQVLTGHAVVQLTDSYYEFTVQNVFMVNIEVDWEGDVNYAKPWLITIELIPC